MTSSRSDSNLRPIFHIDPDAPKEIRDAVMEDLEDPRKRAEIRRELLEQGGAPGIIVDEIVEPGSTSQKPATAVEGLGC